MSRPRATAETAREFDEFLAREAGVVLGLARRLLGDGEAARDLAQDALFKAHQSLARFRGESSLKTWVLRITVNEGLKRLRRRQLKRKVSGWFRAGRGVQAPAGYGLKQAASPERLVGMKQKAAILSQVLDALPPRQRTVIVLRYLEDLGLAEIAELMGVGVGTVKTHLVRAVRKVRAAWPEGEEFEPRGGVT